MQRTTGSEYNAHFLDYLPSTEGDGNHRDIHEGESGGFQPAEWCQGEGPEPHRVV